jgi:hypothetical protein
MKASILNTTWRICSVVALAPGVAAAQHFSAWSAAAAVAEVNSPLGDGCPIEAPDGLHLYLASTRFGNSTGNDIWVAARASESSPWNEPERLDAPVNSDANDFCPTPLAGKWLLFVSERPGEETCSAGPGSGDIYLIRDNPAHGWEDPQHLGCSGNGGPNTNGPEFSPSLVETDEGTFLYYSSNGGSGSQDIYVSNLGDDGLFGPGMVVTELSTEHDDRMPNVSKDGREIVFSSNRPTWGGGQSAHGGQDVYRATRASATGVWSDPENLGSAVNTAGDETRASISRDGERLYFGRSGDIYMSLRYRLTNDK